MVEEDTTRYRSRELQITSVPLSNYPTPTLFSLVVVNYQNRELSDPPNFCSSQKFLLLCDNSRPPLVHDGRRKDPVCDSQLLALDHLMQIG